MRKLVKRNVRRSLVAVSCAAALAACGSSQSQSGNEGSAVASTALKEATCMRAHGVPNFPDPSGGGSGVNLDGTGINPQSPAFKSARQACARFAPGRGPGGAVATETQFLAAVKFAECMRTHGYSDFPDPTHSDSPPGPILIIGTGLFFRVSSNFDPNAPAVARAMAGCVKQ
jgi:hypothetical protein